MAEGNSRDGSSALRQWGGFLLGLAISAIFIYLTLRQVQLDQLVREISEVSLVILSLTLVTKFVGFVCMTLRSQLLFRHIEEIGFGRMFKSILVAFVGNNVLPFRAGELLRVGYLTKGHDEVTGSASLAAIGLERLLDMFTLALLFLSLIFFAFIDFSSQGVPRLTVVYVTTTLLTGAMVAALLVSRFPDFFVSIVEFFASFLGEQIEQFVTEKAERFADGLAGLSSLKQAAGVIGLSFAYWGASVVSVGVWIWAFDLSMPWHAPLVVAVFSAFATVLPSSPGYVGTYHYFVQTAAMFFGVSKTTATSFAIVGHAASMVPFSIIGVLVLMRDWMDGELPTPDFAGEETENP